MKNSRGKKAVLLLSIILDVLILMAPISLVYLTSPTTQHYVLAAAATLGYFILFASGYGMQRWFFRIGQNCARQTKKIPISDELVEIAVISRFGQNTVNSFQESPIPTHSLSLPPNVGLDYMIHTKRTTPTDSLNNSYASSQDIFWHGQPVESLHTGPHVDASNCAANRNLEIPLNPEDLTSGSVHFESTSDLASTSDHDTEICTKRKRVSWMTDVEGDSSEPCHSSPKSGHETELSRPDYLASEADYENLPTRTIHPISMTNHRPKLAMRVKSLSTSADSEIELDRHGSLASQADRDTELAFRSQYPVSESDYEAELVTCEITPYTDEPLWSGASKTNMQRSNKLKTISIKRKTTATKMLSSAASAKRKIPRQNSSQVFFFEADHLMLNADNKEDRITDNDQHFTKILRPSQKEPSRTEMKSHTFGSRTVQEQHLASKPDGRRPHHQYIPDTPSKKRERKNEGFMDGDGCCCEDSDCQDNCIDLCDIVATEARGTSSSKHQAVYASESDSSRESEIECGKTGQPSRKRTIHTEETEFVETDATHLKAEREVARLAEKSLHSSLDHDISQPELDESKPMSVKLAHFSELLKEPQNVELEGCSYQFELENEAKQLRFEETKLISIKETYFTESEKDVDESETTDRAESNYELNQRGLGETKPAVGKSRHSCKPHTVGRNLTIGKNFPQRRVEVTYTSDSSSEYERHFKNDNFQSNCEQTVSDESEQSEEYYKQTFRQRNLYCNQSTSEQTDQSESVTETDQSEPVTETDQSESARENGQSESEMETRQSESSETGTDQSERSTLYEGDIESGCDELDLHVTHNGDVRGCLHCIVKDRMTKTRNLLLAYLLKNMQDVYHLYDIRDREAIYRRDVSGLDRRIRVKVDAVRRVTQIQKAELIEMVKTEEVISDICQIVEDLDPRFGTDTEDTESSTCSTDVSPSSPSSSITSSSPSYNNDTYVIESGSSYEGSDDSERQRRRRCRM